MKGQRSPLAQNAQLQAPDGYAPEKISCPSSRPVIRNATKLSSQEIDWTQLRDKEITSSLKSFLGRADIDGFDAESYINGIIDKDQQLPRIGIAVSGGGYRALMNGAGALSAFDNRSQDSTSSGHTGGLLQAATYVSGLSGGSWVVGSLFIQNFTTVDSIILSDSGFLSQLWQFDESILEGEYEPLFGKDVNEGIIANSLQDHQLYP